MTNRQLDLFITLSASDVVTKHSRDLMERCWFNLSKNKRSKEIYHQTKNGDWCRVRGGDYGIATIWDMNVLLFATSHIVDRINKGENVSPMIRFSGYEFQHFIGAKKHSGQLDKDLQKALERLHTTRIETNIRLPDNVRKYQSFYWINRVDKWVENGRVIGYAMELPKWYFDTIVNHKQILTIDDDYFNIRGGIEKFLYLWCRKSVGYRKDYWKESFISLHKKSSSIGTLRAFTFSLRKIIKKQSIHNYYLKEKENYLYVRRCDDKEKLLLELDTECASVKESIAHSVSSSGE